MTTTQQDNELNAEIQELYLKTKHWISDLNFMESNLYFLKRFAESNFPVLIKFVDLDKIAEIMLNFDKIEKAHSALKNDIPKYLHRLEPLIIESDQNFDIGLMETHMQLERQVNDMLFACKSAKNTLYHLAKQEFKQMPHPQ